MSSVQDGSKSVPEVPTFVSVIVPVLNDLERLRLCLDALESQTYPDSLYEVIVVDNGSKEPLDSLVTGFSHACLTFENRSSSYAARNHGLSIAKGGIIAFTDSDCIPTSNWIEKGVDGLLRETDCGLLAGRIEIFFQNPDRPTAVELYQRITAFQQKVNIEKSRFGVTANLFTFRHVIERVGPFNPILKSGGDYEWGQRVYSAGYRLVYVGDVCVAHPARRSLRQLQQRVIRVENGTEEVRRMQSADQQARYSFVHPIVELFLTLLPNLRKAVRIYSDRMLSRKDERVKVAFVALYVLYLRFWEKWRIRLSRDAGR